MPREPRIYIENVLYLVTARGDEDRDLFSDSQDFFAYIKSLTEYKREYGFKLFAYALMPKTLYLLIELENNVTISQIMHDLNSRYTKTYNSRYGKKGHLFQSRFKSILIEKDDYLLRLSRFIHLLPKDSGLVEDPKLYSYSSCSQFATDSGNRLMASEMPEMTGEIIEILSYFTKMETEETRRKAYEDFMYAADDEEVELVQKLLHRKAFIGSKDFVTKIRHEIKNHIIEEKESRIVRKTNPAFALAGGLIMIFLAFVAYNLSNSQSALQETLDKTANGFETAREDLTNRVFTLEDRLVGFETRQNHGLGGFAWELRLTPVQAERARDAFKDYIQFKDGKVISNHLMGRGFEPFDYTITKETHGTLVWKTVQTNTDGLTVRWYGIITGDQMRGVFSEIPACLSNERQAGRLNCQNRDFSFVSLKRVKDPGRAENAIQ